LLLYGIDAGLGATTAEAAGSTAMLGWAVGGDGACVEVVVSEAA
jgi:hypothetical protein